MSDDWRDGFLFVGNHLLLDFINTRPIMDGESPWSCCQIAGLWRAGSAPRASSTKANLRD